MKLLEGCMMKINQRFDVNLQNDPNDQHEGMVLDDTHTLASDHTTMASLTPEQPIGYLAPWATEKWILFPNEADFDGCWSYQNFLEEGDFVIAVSDVVPVRVNNAGGTAGSGFGKRNKWVGDFCQEHFLDSGVWFLVLLFFMLR